MYIYVYTHTYVSTADTELKQQKKRLEHLKVDLKERTKGAKSAGKEFEKLQAELDKVSISLPPTPSPSPSAPPSPSPSPSPAPSLALASTPFLSVCISVTLSLLSSPSCWQGVRETAG